MTNPEASPHQDLFYQQTISSYVKNERFLHRDWLAGAVAEKLKKPECRFVLLTAEPGAGKSAFMAQLAHDELQSLRYYIRSNFRAALADAGAKSFLLRLGYQLAALKPDLFVADNIRLSVEQSVGQIDDAASVVGAEIKRLIASPFHQKVVHISQHITEHQGSVAGLRIAELVLDTRSLSIDDLQHMALFNPALALQRTEPGAQLLILVDALDELIYHDQGETMTLLDWLTHCPPLPANVRFVLSSRPNYEALRLFQAKQEPFIQAITITPETAFVESDVRQFVTQFILTDPVRDQLQNYDRDVEVFTADLITQASGNLGYLDALARGIDNAASYDVINNLINNAALPADFADMLAFCFVQLKVHMSGRALRRIDPETGDLLRESLWAAVCKPLLSVLAVARAPLTLTQLSDFAALSDEDWDALVEVIDLLGPYLDHLDDRYRLYHATVAEFLTHEELKKEADRRALFVPAQLWHKRIATHFWRQFADQWQDCREDYALVHLMTHLAQAGDAGRQAALISTTWMQARLRHDHYADVGFEHDLTQAAQTVLGDTSRLPAFIRYHLLRSTLAALGNQAPPHLLARLVDEGRWPAARAISAADRLGDLTDRATAYRLLEESQRLDVEQRAAVQQNRQAVESLLPPPISVPEPEPVAFANLQQALERVIGEKRRSLPGIGAAGPHSDPLSPLRDALKAFFISGTAAASPESHFRFHQMLGLKPVLGTGADRRLEGEIIFAHALSVGLDRDLAEQLMPDLLPRIIALRNQRPLRIALLAIAPYLPEEDAAVVLEKAFTLGDQTRFDLIDRLAPRLPSHLLLDVVARLRQSEDDSHERMVLLRALLPHMDADGGLQADVVQKALALAQSEPGYRHAVMQSPRIEAILSLWPWLPAEQQAAALETAAAIATSLPTSPNQGRTPPQAMAYGRLLSFVPPDERQRQARRLLNMLYDTEEPHLMTPALLWLWPHLDQATLHQALNFVPHQDVELQDMLRTNDETVLTPPVIEQALVSTMLEIWDDTLRVAGLRALMPQLSAPAISQAWGIIETLPFNELVRSRVIVTLAPHLLPEFIVKAVEVTQNLEAPGPRLAAQMALLPRLERGLQNAILGEIEAGLNKIDDQSEKARLWGQLAAAVPAWAQNHQEQAIDIVFDILTAEADLTRRTYLQRLADLLPMWQMVGPAGISSQIARVVLEVCWEWEWM